MCTTGHDGQCLVNFNDFDSTVPVTPSDDNFLTVPANSTPLAAPSDNRDLIVPLDGADFAVSVEDDGGRRDDTQHAVQIQETLV